MMCFYNYFLIKDFTTKKINGIKISSIVKGKNQTPILLVSLLVTLIVCNVIKPKITTIINFKYLINRVEIVYCLRAFSVVIFVE
jgi:hypothetical protein